MNIQWIGMLVVTAGCGGVGFRMAWQARQEGKNLRSLTQSLREMENQLEYQMLPLPELCRRAGEHSEGPVARIMQQLSGELTRQIAPNASCCMQAVLAEREDLEPQLRQLLEKLGTSLGRFDLTGQLEGLRALRAEAEHCLQVHQGGEAERVKSYQTLGLCAGAALAILFL